jgi:site-specific recombinase XerC
MTALAPLLQAFFTERLPRERCVSPHTIASYRDSFRLLLAFVHERTRKPPSKLTLEDLDAQTIAAFLGHLENERGNSVRTVTSYSTVIECVFGFVGRHASVSSAVRGAA